MARIRSIKPEFWKSDAIASHSFFTRLAFIGLWTYVDDNGVGIDNPKLIVAELFPLEDDFARVSRDLRESLASLAASGRILRYTVDSKPFLSIVNWHEHQKIDRPGKARYPQADDPRAVPVPVVTRDSPPVLEVVATPSRDSRESLATPSLLDQGSGSSGSGIRDQGVPPTAGALTLAAPDTTQALVGEWIEHCPNRPPGPVIGQVSKQIKNMLGEGIAAPHVRRGLAEWARKGLHPSTLPSVVNEVMNAGAGSQIRKPSTADQRFGEAMELAARFAQEEAS